MPSDNLTATFSVSEATRGGTQPAGTTVNLRVSSDGFHDAGGLGAGGQDSAAMDAARVAAMLRQHYDAEQLQTLLQHFVQLHAALTS